jgi:AcrR family transcriptional regulator
VTGASIDPRALRSRHAILAGAAEVLVADGWDAVTQDAVAARSGVNRATVYRHWPDRGELVVDAVEALIDTVAIDMHAAPSGDLRQDLSGELRRFARLATDPRQARLIGALIQNAAGSPSVAALRSRLAVRHTAALRAALARGIDDGELDAGTDVDVAVAELFGPVVYRILFSGETARVTFVDAVVDDFLGRARAASGARGRQSRSSSRR